MASAIIKIEEDTGYEDENYTRLLWLEEYAPINLKHILLEWFLEKFLLEKNLSSKDYNIEYMNISKFTDKYQRFKFVIDGAYGKYRSWLRYNFKIEIHENLTLSPKEKYLTHENKAIRDFLKTDWIY